MTEFYVDETGLIPSKPLKGWNLGHVGGTALLLEVHYADNLEELETDQKHTLCLALSLPIALELSEKLRTYAQGFLNQTAPAGTKLH